MKTKFKQFGELWKKSQKPLIISHRKPDGDTLGASSALYQLAQSMGKDATMACVDVAADKFHFMPGVLEIEHEFDFEDYDLIVVSDAGAHYMTSYHEIYPEIFSGKKVPVVNIDHHISNDNFGTLNIVDTDSASATVIVFKLFKYLKYEITADIATSLMAGIYNDTGSFMHSNTGIDVYEVAAELHAAGAQLSLIVKSMFQSNPVSTLRLWGRVLDKMEVTSDGITMAVVTQADCDELGVSSEQTSGVIDYLNAVPGSRYALLLTEDGKGNVKGSMRTQREDVDLSKIAGEFGGGGHAKASGFSIAGRIEEVNHYKLVPSDSSNMKKDDQKVLTDHLRVRLK